MYNGAQQSRHEVAAICFSVIDPQSLKDARDQATNFNKFIIVATKIDLRTDLEGILNSIM
jgi:hypothetical protein